MRIFVIELNYYIIREKSFIMLTKGGIVKSSFLFLSQNPSYYGHQVAQELGIENEVSSDKLLEVLQSKIFEEIADKNNLFETYLVSMLYNFLHQ